jgi:small subunit ribosomal protein S21
MLIVDNNGGNIEKALKKMKGKLIRTKQNRKLNAKRYFTKKSVKRRAEIGKAKHVQKKYGDKK